MRLAPMLCFDLLMCGIFITLKNLRTLPFSLLYIVLLFLGYCSQTKILDVQFLFCSLPSFIWWFCCDYNTGFIRSLHNFASHCSWKLWKITDLLMKVIHWGEWSSLCCSLVTKCQWKLNVHSCTSTSYSTLRGRSDSWSVLVSLLKVYSIIQVTPLYYGILASSQEPRRGEIGIFLLFKARTKVLITVHSRLYSQLK